MDLVVPLLEARLGARLPGVVERHAVVSRAQWATANMETFKALIRHLEPYLTPRLPEGSVRAGFAAATNRLLTTGQVGFLLGYLGSRVLGQYDVALLSAEQEPGRLLYVEENIRATARLVKVPVDDFRLWVALHETTHAFELEAHPWLRPYIRVRLERQVALFAQETLRLQRHGLAHLARRWRTAAAEGSLRGFLSPEQRGLFKETQLVMSLMEGFSDWVMDEVGAEVLPDVPDIRRRFEERRGQRRRAIDRLMARITGMDIKLEQYHRGERFVSGVNRIGGPAAIARLWDGPETLPSDRRDGRSGRVGPTRAAGRIRTRGECMTEATRSGREPAAIALTPILSARYREADLARIRAAAPGARLVNVSLEGLSDSPLDDVEVLLRGPIPTATFDRLLARCPRLRWVHSATAGVERVLTPRGCPTRPDHHQCPWRLQRAHRRVHDDDDPLGVATATGAHGAAARNGPGSRCRRESCARSPSASSASAPSAATWPALALAFGARVIGTRKEPDMRKDFTEPLPDGMDRVLAHDQLPELLAESDFVVLTVPLTPETDKLMDGPRLALMKPGSWLINVARGRLVDQRALLRALRTGPLEGAILDTIWEEPLPPSSPLWDAPGLIITPHTSWSSGRVLDRSIELFCDNLVRYRDGREMLNLVDPAAGY